MNVIKLPVLRAFWEQHADAESALPNWYATARKAKWQTPADVKATYDQTDAGRKGRN